VAFGLECATLAMMHNKKPATQLAYLYAGTTETPLALEFHKQVEMNT
jgi:hypothetical protein